MIIPAPRRFSGETLVIASHNRGKVREIAELLRPYARHFRSAGALGLPEPEETGTTFAANAELKARAAATGARFAALADDSGLAVNALDGQPGIQSARWGGPERDFLLAMTRVNDELGTNPDRSAAFICALSLAWPDGHCETVEGRVEGTLVWPPRGSRGFGYDPIFVPAGHDQTFGELPPATKHALSHRADAFRKLVARCFG
ncbi:MAG: RdgB/HAM1 family non-canonical purine NTP pyrophosphatase [Rhodospirillaceae bacterium]